MFRRFFHKQRKVIRRDVIAMRRDLVARQGKEQFKKLVDLGLGLPIALR